MLPDTVEAQVERKAHSDDDSDGYSGLNLACDLNLTAEQLHDLRRFRSLLKEASAQMNLVGPSALSQFWRRHVLDSGQLLDVSPQSLRWADLGAGAGFPGVVLAIRLKGRTGAMVHLIESQAKRCRFLEGVANALSLPVTVHWARAETLDHPPTVDVVTARACAPLTRLFDYAAPFMTKGIPGLFLKGRSAAAEIAEARKTWRFKASLLPSRSAPAEVDLVGDPAGWIVRVEGLARA